MKAEIIWPLVATAVSFSFVVIAMGDDPDESDHLERKFKKSKAAILVDMFKRMPSIWFLKRKAKKLVASLPGYKKFVPLPDSNIIYSWIESLCSTPHRRPGTAENRQAENWIADRFREFGLENVKMDPVEMTVWEAKRWSLTVRGKKIDSFFVVNTGFTDPEGVTAPLVYVGTGKAGDFSKVDVTGKIVVADVPFPEMPYGRLFKTFRMAYAVSDPEGHITKSSKQYLNFVRMNFIGGATAKDAPKNDVYWQAHRRGAKAICLILRDQPSDSNSHYGPYDAIMKPMPALWIGKYDGEELRRLATEGAKADLVLEGSTRPGVMHNVWGVLPGQSEEVILVTSHHDSPFQGAIEDATGTAQVLAQAYAWAKVPKEQRPKTLVFVVDGGHFYGSKGAFEFARKHMDIMKRTKILITLEHLAAKETEERNRKYAETGRLALTIMFTSSDPVVIATVMKAFEKTSPKIVASVPADLFGPVPTSDAAGYVAEAGVPVISWIGCPYCLLDEYDTLDKIEKTELAPISGTVAELIKTYMAMK